MKVLNSSSSIISSFQVGTRSFPSFVSVMAGEGVSPANPELVVSTEACSRSGESICRDHGKG